jgi:hypothetical protein
MEGDLVSLVKERQGSCCWLLSNELIIALHCMRSSGQESLTKTCPGRQRPSRFACWYAAVLASIKRPDFGTPAHVQPP